MIDKIKSSDRTLSLDRITKLTVKVLSNKKSVVGILILLPLLTATILSPIITPHSPTETHVEDRYEGPSSEYIMGTDHLGRDIFSRVLAGGQTTFTIGLASVGLALLFGIPIGLVSGYNGGTLDELTMRAMDILISIPTLLLALLILSILEPSLQNAILTIGIVYTPRIARIVRGSTLSIKQETFISAAEARGESQIYILFKEILPNILSPIIVEGSIRIGFAILIGTSLSFLGLGSQPPDPDWGFMIAQARNYTWQTPWYVLWPSIALGLTVLGFNILGDGLRDVLDPKTESDL